MYRLWCCYIYCCCILEDQQEQNVIFDQQSKIIDAARLLEVYPSSQEALASMRKWLLILMMDNPQAFLHNNMI